MRTSREEEVTPPLLAEASLKHHHAVLLQVEAGGLGEEEVGALDNVLEPGLAVLEHVYVVDVDGLGRPPQGTKRSALDESWRWKRLRNSMHRSTTVPSGR